MLTIRTYRHALKNLEKLIRQTIRSSHRIVSGKPIEVRHGYQLLTGRHAVDDLHGARHKVHESVKHAANPIVTAGNPCEGRRSLLRGGLARTGYRPVQNVGARDG